MPTVYLFQDLSAVVLSGPHHRHKRCGHERSDQIPEPPPEPAAPALVWAPEPMPASQTLLYHAGHINTHTEQRSRNR